MVNVLDHADAEQARLMEERVILVDRDDHVTGAGSKKETHIWENIKNGLLHRAFSVFLLTQDGRLVLQKRSPAKITFPEYWANTCCSHPLHFEKELDEKNAMGVKRAAVRKMQQELGVDPAELPLSSFQFVSRIHYSAPCGKHGRPEDYWGEHEIDHILICMPEKTPVFRPNPNEVEEVRAFSPSELAHWVSTAEKRGDRVSPWFRLMERTMLYKWWSAAAHGLRGVRNIMETDVIHRLDEMDSEPSEKQVMEDATNTENAWANILQFSIPQSESRLGWSCAHISPEQWAPPVSSASSKNDSIRKQGAYGKIITHKESMLKQLLQLDELWAAFTYKTGFSDSAKVTKLSNDATPEHIFCEDMLCQVSRSFAMVIQQLSPRLRKSVCVFYLVLRGLDTVEDDMVAFLGHEDEKLAHLRAFYTYLEDPEWNMRGVGEAAEARLLEGFDKVVCMFKSLPEDDQIVISDICKRMGYGMARYVGRDLREGTDDIEDYNLYCHYVAGLVGEGLSRLFSATGKEDPSLAEARGLANEMGLFLQKTNIIRDYLEDLVEGRAFWPRSIWNRYTKRLADLRGHGGPSFADGSHPHQAHPQARACLNHLVADALTHAPACLRYLGELHSDDVFRFCAIPQVMAIATLDKLANNEDVFTGVVKIRKGLALRLIQDADSMQNVVTVFLKHSRSIASKIPPEHEQAYDLVQRAAQATEEQALSLLPPAAAAFHSNILLSQLFSLPTVGIVVVFTLSLLRYLHQRSRDWADTGRYMPRITDSWDVAAVTATIACLLYLVAFTGVPLIMNSSQPLPLPEGDAKLLSTEFEYSDEFENDLSKPHLTRKRSDSSADSTLRLRKRTTA